MSVGRSHAARTVPLADPTVVVGVDVGGTWLRVLTQGSAGRSDLSVVPVPRTLDALVARVAELVSETSGDPVDRVGMGLPGWTGSRVPTWVPNLPFLDGAPLADAVEAAVGGMCVLVNVAQAALIAEQREGAAAGCSSALLVSLGTGIGGAVLLDGRLVRGARGCAGSFGWLPMTGGDANPDHGDWEQVASGTALARAGAPWGGADGVVAAARAGDPEAVDVVDRIGTLLGRGTAGLASIFDPEVVVLAGGVSASIDVLGPPMRAAHDRHASPSGRGVPLVDAALGDSAGALGAMYAALMDEEAA